MIEELVKEIITTSQAWSVKHMKEKVDELVDKVREQTLEEVEETITNYDEEYINEDVRTAINRMKHSLLQSLKKK